MQSRENNMNFMSNFSGENQIPKMSPIGQGNVLNFKFPLLNLKLYFIISILIFSLYSTTTATNSNAAYSCA